MLRNGLRRTKQRRTNLVGYSSFIARHPKQEYQIDLFFMNENPDDEYKIALLLI
jgi:hypothetical protein